MSAELLPRINSTTQAIIASAIRVHRTLGPGLLESAYLTCLLFEMTRAGLRLKIQSPVPIIYEDVRLDCGYRLDFIVNDSVIVEVKSVKQLEPIHEAQVLTYLKLTGYPAALLINFNVQLLTSGIRRLLNPRPTR
jgi:GxxExxY protein